LNEKLELLYCFSNKLTSLPILNENLEILWCEHNQLTSLPQLNENLRQLYCDNNQLTSLPHLNEKLKGLYISDNPISEIINGETTNEKRIQIQLLNNFRHLYYSLKFKKQFRDWLWVKIREHKAIKKYNPDYLVEHLQEDIDLNDFLDNWV
jgi:Leucine-rich repeat (LRR) protein